MNPLLVLARRALRHFTLLFRLAWWSPLLLLAPAAHAGPVVFAPYAGSGNAVLFDASTGAGGWVGAIEQSPDPAVIDPLSLVSFVVFTYDAVVGSLSGTFEFTRSTDLGSTLFGVLTGSTADADIFDLGGQLSLDYDIQGGSGLWAGASGFGLAFLQFDPLATPDNYAESGLLVFNLPDPLLVPEPASLSLVALGLVGALTLRRRRTPAN